MEFLNEHAYILLSKIEVLQKILGHYITLLNIELYFNKNSRLLLFIYLFIIVIM